MDIAVRLPTLPTVDTMLAMRASALQLVAKLQFPHEALFRSAHA